MIIRQFKLSAIAALLVTLAACQTTTGDNVTIPENMPPNLAKHFQRYLDEMTYQKFYAITLDGRGAYYIYCENIAGCEPGLSSDLLHQCSQRYGRPCKIFARNNQIISEYPGPN